MSFRKRNLVINRGAPAATAAPTPVLLRAPPPPGVRPSPINGQPTTSTGTPSLDALLAGHAGLPLGCSLLVEEPGTTDFGGALLRYYAAEGIVQGHAVTVVGFGEAWARDLPAVTGDHSEEFRKGVAERMKIAWRYEKLGEFGSGIGGSRAQSIAATPRAGDTTTTTTTTAAAASAAASAAPPATQFCHSFDLTKRLTIPAGAKLAFIPAPLPTSASPFAGILAALNTHAASHPPTLPHRVLLPSLLSPLLYPPAAAHPSQVLPFLHALRALLRRHPGMTLVASIPLELYPRDTGLVRWAEILSDSVLELTPLPHRPQRAGEEPAPQGLVKMWKLPVAGGKGGDGEDLAFTLTRKRFEIRAYSLPPADDGVDRSDGGEGHEHVHGKGKGTKVDVEF